MKMKIYAPIGGAVLTLFSAPALADHAGPTALGAGSGINVLSPDTLDEGKAAGGFRLTYTRPNQRSDDELEALAGQHIHAHNTDYNLNAAIGFAYGITHHLTVSVELPYVRRDGLREGEHSHSGGESVNEVAELGDVAGLGDASILAKYGLTHDETVGLAIVAGIKIPTGSTGRRSVDGERLETEHQTGSGSWDPILGASAAVKLGPLRLNASALYQFSGKGVQETKLGDRAVAGVSLSHRFRPPEHHHDDADEGEGHHDGGHEHAKPHLHRSWDAFVEMSGEWEGRQTVNGEVESASGGKSLWLTPGARFNSSSGLSVTAALGLPVWQDIRPSHPDNDYRVTLSAGKTF